MITGAAQMDGAILVVSADRRPHAPDARARAPGPPGRCAGIVVFLNKVDLSTTPSCSTSSRWRSASCSTSTSSPATRPRSSAASPRPPSRTPRTTRQAHRRPHQRHRQLHPRAQARGRQALPDAVEDVFSIKGRGTVATGRIERGVVKVGEVRRDRRPRARTSRRPSPASRCSRRPSTRARPATTSACSSAASRRTTSSAAGHLQAQVDHPHTKFKGEVYVLTKEEGGRHTPFFSGTARSSTSARRT
jgi:elongation factor Tu